MEIKTNKYGFYIHPCALTSKEWKEWRAETKRLFPKQWFIRETLGSWVRYKRHQINEFFYYLRCRYHKYNIIKLDNNCRWRDSDARIERSLEIILRDFIEQEEPWDVVVWKEPDEIRVKRDLVNAYYFFVVEKATIESQINQLMEELYGGPFEDFFDETKERDKKKTDELSNLEAQLDEKTTIHLQNIVKYRNYMWT